MAMTAPATEALITGEELLEMGDIEETFAIGVDRVWIVEPDRKTVLVYRTPTEMSAFGPGETVAGEGALDGFAVAINELFDE